VALQGREGVPTRTLDSGGGESLALPAYHRSNNL